MINQTTRKTTTRSKDIDTNVSKVKILPITTKQGQSRKVKKYKTEIGQAIANIIDDPYFPTKRLPGAYPDKTDEEVSALYENFAKKWLKIRYDKKFCKKTVSPEKAKGLSLDDFTSLATDFFGREVLNRDVVNRVLHTGNTSVRIRAKKVNESVILLISHFSKIYTFRELIDMAAQAIAEAKNTEVFEDKIKPTLILDQKNSLEKNLEIHDQAEKEHKKLASLTLASLIDQYTTDHGYDTLLKEIQKINGYQEEIKAKALVFDLLTGSQQLPIGIIVVLSQILEVKAEKMIEIIKRSFIVEG